MTELIDPSEVERLVGAYRHPTAHLCRADSFHEATYLLHSKACLDSGIDLRTCEYALAQDNGIDTDVWEGREDEVVLVVISDSHLVPTKRMPEIVTGVRPLPAWCGCGHPHAEPAWIDHQPNCLHAPNDSEKEPLASMTTATGPTPGA